jgi:hypothetical protein
MNESLLKKIDKIGNTYHVTISILDLVMMLPQDLRKSFWKREDL